MRLRTKLRLPKEHGAWVMLYAPFALGAIAAGSNGGRQIFLGLAVTFVFIGRESLLAWWRSRTRGREDPSALRTLFVYLGLAAAAGAPLLLVHELHGMIPLGAVAGILLAWNARQAARREERTLPTEIVGIAGLTMTAPAAYYTGTGAVTPDAAWLWAASALYFLSSVFYVRLRVMAAYPKQPEALARIRRQCAVYHALLAAALAGLWAAGLIHPFLAAAFAPALTRAGWHAARLTTELRLAKVGIQEIAYAVIFLVFAAMAWAT